MNARKDENKGKTHADKLIPKPHIRPVDLLDGDVTLRIKGHDWDEFMDQRSKTNQTKGIITFDRTDKYLIVNKTQKDQIIEICGSEYIEDWYGKRITLYLREEKIGAEMKMCVRVKKPPKARTAEEGIAELGFTPDYEDTVEPADKEIKTSEVDESKPWHKRVVEATRAKTHLQTDVEINEFLDDSGLPRDVTVAAARVFSELYQSAVKDGVLIHEAIDYARANWQNGGGE